MKKFLPLILCFSAFFLFSCASKPPVQSELSPEINAPSTDEEKTAPAAWEYCPLKWNCSCSSSFHLLPFYAIIGVL